MTVWEFSIVFYRFFKWLDPLVQRLISSGGGGGVFSHMAYTGICCWSVDLFQLLCSATLDQLLVLAATFVVLATIACVQTSPISFAACGKGNVPFPRATKEIGDVCTQAIATSTSTSSNFWAKYRFRAHIKHEKVDHFIGNFNLWEFLKCQERIVLLGKYLAIFWTHTISQLSEFSRPKRTIIVVWIII